MQPFSLGALTSRSFVVSATTGNLVSPIVITLPLGHTLVNGDVGTVAGITGNTAANGSWLLLQVGPTSAALYNAANGAASTGNGATGTGTVTAPAHLTFAAGDNNTDPKVAKIYFESLIANKGISFVGLTGLNQATAVGVIRQLNLDASGGGRADFYNLDGDGSNRYNLTDYCIDCAAPSTDFVMATYWRG
jgi:hypothetical protein